MAFRIEKREEFIEVHLWGQGHVWEVLAALKQLHGLAPRKEVSDLWLIAEEYVVPWEAFATIVSALNRLIPRDLIPTKSAIVVASQFQVIQARLYQQQAACLPYQTGVFLTRDEAIQWLKA